MTRLIHDASHDLSLRLLGVVRFALTEEQAGNIRLEIYHLIRDGLLRHAEAVAMEGRRLDPLKGGEPS